MLNFTRTFCLTILFAGLALLGPGASAYAAGPTPDTRFWLPVQVDGSTTVTVQQGNFGSYDHQPGNQSQYAFDFTVGSSSFVVTAATSGTIEMGNSPGDHPGYRDDSDVSCDKNGKTGGTTPFPADRPCWTMANYVLITDDDGQTATLYLHLEQGSVTPYMSRYPNGHVLPGDPIGVADTTGWATGVHLHFQVEAVPSAKRRADPRYRYSWWWTQSIPVTFSNPEVLEYEVRNPDWMTTWCGKTCPEITLNQAPPRPTPTPPPITPGGPGTASCTTGPTGLIGAGLLVLFLNRFNRRRRSVRSTGAPTHEQEHKTSAPPAGGPGG